MFLTAHSAIALAATAWTGNPAAAFAVGWASHYLADAVPHGDEPVGRWAKAAGPREAWHLAVVTFVDLSFLAVAFAWFISARGLHLVHIAAIVGACLPDFMWGLEKVVGRKLFGPLGAFHSRVHNFAKVMLPLAVGLLGQAALAAALWWWVAAGH